MTKNEWNTLLDELEIPYHYYQFEETEAVAPPFFVWYIDSSSNFYADGVVYSSVNKIILEIYFDQKDFEKEKMIEQIFLKNQIKWKKDEQWLTDEQPALFEVIYEMEVMMNE